MNKLVYLDGQGNRQDLDSPGLASDHESRSEADETMASTAWLA